MQIITEKIVPEKQVTVPQYIERPRWRYSFDNTDIKRGQIVEIIIKVDGEEVESMKHEVQNDVEAGKELRPLITYDPAIMAAFPKIEKEIEEIK